MISVSKPGNVVNVKSLWSGRNRFDKSQQAEACAGKWLAKKKQWIVESQTFGNDPRYDIVVSGFRIEIKFQTSIHLGIEFARYDNSPSGIFACEADYYLMFNPGSSSDSQSPTGFSTVGKARLIKVTDLKKLVIEKMLKGDVVSYPPNENGPGCRMVMINSKKDMFNNDGWLGDIGYSDGNFVF